MIKSVNATYDPVARSVYVKLTDKKVKNTVPIEQVLVYYDLDKDNEIVGLEVIFT